MFMRQAISQDVSWRGGEAGSASIVLGMFQPLLFLLLIGLV
jgi:hypothetical protein